MIRGFPLVLVICPKFEPVGSVFGFAKNGVLVALNISARNCNRYRSANGKFFAIARSRFVFLGPLIKFFAELPKVPGAFGRNAAGLKYWFSHCDWEPLCTLRGWPVRSALSLPF